MRVLVSCLRSADWICRSLAQHEGVEVAALQASYTDQGEFGRFRAVPTPDMPYPLHAIRVVPVRPYTASMYVGGVASLLRSFRPDIFYHFGEPSELGSWQVIRLARRVCPRAGLVLFTLENVQREFRGFPRCVRGWAARATLPRLDMVVAASRSAAAAWEAQGFDPSRIRVVYPALDTQRLYPRDAGRLRAQLGGPDDLVVGFIGRLAAEKGVDLLLNAVAQLPPRYRLAIGGAGPAEPDLRALGETLQLGGRVQWLGRIPSEEVPLYMSAFDALVLPSRSLPVWQEQFGRVLVESMLCGTPVVGSSCGAIPDVIGDAGLVFPEEHPDALAQCLRRLVEEPGLREDLARRGLRRAHQEFTIQVHSDRLVRIFRELTGEAQ